MIYLVYWRDPGFLILNSVEFCDTLHLNGMLRDQAILKLINTFFFLSFIDQIDLEPSLLIHRLECYF